MYRGPDGRRCGKPRFHDASVQSSPHGDWLIVAGDTTVEYQLTPEQRARLRDDFALEAYRKFPSEGIRAITEAAGSRAQAIIADDCYAMADAMLAAREKRRRD
jgi:hypothetical protein